MYSSYLEKIKRMTISTDIQMFCNLLRKIAFRLKSESGLIYLSFLNGINKYVLYIQLRITLQRGYNLTYIKS